MSKKVQRIVDEAQVLLDSRVAELEAVPNQEKLVGRTIRYTVDPEWGLLAAILCAIADEKCGFTLAQLKFYSNNWTDNGNIEVAILFFKHVHQVCLNPNYRPAGSNKVLYTLPEIAKMYGFFPYPESN